MEWLIKGSSFDLEKFLKKTTLRYNQEDRCVKNILFYLDMLSLIISPFWSNVMRAK